MRSSLAIGDFARATHLSVKTLRHYHRIGLLVPAAVDERTGYRYYATEQIPTAQVIRRFRGLDMPLEQVQAVLAAPDVATRNDLIAAHLDRLEDTLARTREAVASLRDLLRDPAEAAPIEITLRTVPAVPAAAVHAEIDLADATPWFEGAIGELRATLAAQGLAGTGPAGGIYATGLFADEHGAGTVFVPCHGPVRPAGRVVPFTVPAAELAVTVHAGGHEDIDRAYGALGAYVAEHALGLDGPIREYYLTGRHDTPDATRWRTAIGWPVFGTGEVTR
ncbi:MerR family transcriptional regulator [Amycolatopsis saalfeldensis]|uniref:DNA-binding transcriptional regulator, MerR family n=1 Tax=Amycolatopsis saalfeldensis TaxID=394193 RepID=A0A1H8YF73_9PSEU|nr:MerR family transcriptional regulator [Amycolatopsis saalfeldensis]SEP50884.1 DNA-binding transcriptional regulator, MerR family [Amycolatopsis saalfeldensis]